MSKPTEPLRGDAAWRAQKKAIADRNEAAYARGRQERAAANARVTARRRADDLEERRRISAPR
jgi:hypothetical protein